MSKLGSRVGFVTYGHVYVALSSGRRSELQSSQCYEDRLYRRVIRSPRLEKLWIRQLKRKIQGANKAATRNPGHLIF